MNIEYTKNFMRSYKKLDIFICKKIKERIDLFSKNPLHPLLHDHSVHPVFKHGRSINITGDYRAIYVRYGESRIVFTDIGTHSELYD